MILALDLGSTITGFAIGEAFAIHASGYWHIKCSRYDDIGMRPLRLKRSLERMHMLWPITEIAYEAIKFSSTTYSSQMWGMMSGAMFIFAKERNLPYAGVDIGAWKKQSCGRGNASKEDVRKAVNRITGKRIDCQDEADAVAILLYRFVNEA